MLGLLSDFHIWFEAVPVSTPCSPFVRDLDDPNRLFPKGTNSTYKPRAWLPCFLSFLPPQFTFSTETNLVLPNAWYTGYGARTLRQSSNLSKSPVPKISSLVLQAGRTVIRILFVYIFSNWKISGSLRVTILQTPHRLHTLSQVLILLRRLRWTTPDDRATRQIALCTSIYSRSVLRDILINN